MIFFFSGHSSNDTIPEKAIRKESPGVMLTFYDIHKRTRKVMDRFKKHLDNTRNKTKK